MLYERFVMPPRRMVGIVPHPLAFRDSGQLGGWARCAGICGRIAGERPPSWSDRGHPDRTHTSFRRLPCWSSHASCGMRAPHASPAAPLRASALATTPTPALGPLACQRPRTASRQRTGMPPPWLDDSGGRRDGNRTRDRSPWHPLIPCGAPCRARLDLVFCPNGRSKGGAVLT